MTPHPFKQVDVFTSEPFRGNPVAVVFAADTLSDTQMRVIARWTNLSETTFVLPATRSGADSGADYRVRIFTPVAELPFAGHPTLGTAHAVLESGLADLHDGSLVQECGVGLVRIHHTGPGRRLALELPDAQFTALEPESLAELEAALGGPCLGAPSIVDLGPRWLTAQTPSITALQSLTPDFARLGELSRELHITGVNLFARTDGATEVRSFAPAFGVDEDPVCGSGNGAVAALLRARGEVQSYMARQGRNIGRDGYAFLDFVPDGPIRLGGDSITCLDGHLVAPSSSH